MENFNYTFDDKKENCETPIFQIILCYVGEFLFYPLFVLLFCFLYYGVNCIFRILASIILFILFIPLYLWIFICCFRDATKVWHFFFFFFKGFFIWIFFLILVPFAAIFNFFRTYWKLFTKQISPYFTQDTNIKAALDILPERFFDITEN